MRTIVRKLLLLLVSTLFGLALCELALRLFGQHYSGSTYTADALVGWSLRPGAEAWETDEGVAWSRINRHGYRDRERTVPKPANTYRVAVLGDSITEARQVEMEQTFTALAEAELNRQPCCNGRAVEVLNFGIPGHGTSQELLLLRERVWQFSPDLIVLQFYSGNDIFNNHRAVNISTPEKAPYFLLRNGKLELDESFRQGRAFDPFYIKLKGLGADVLNHSLLLQLAYKVNRVRVQRAELARLDTNSQAVIAPEAPPTEYQRYLAYLPPTIPPMIEAWQVTEALLTEFNAEVRAHHVPLLLLLAPTTHQIHPDPQTHEAYRAKYKIASLEYADDRIEQHARAQGIPVLRLTPPLLAEAQRTGTYMAGFANTAPNEGHYNERGHVVIARELVQAIGKIAAEAPPMK